MAEANNLDGLVMDLQRKIVEDYNGCLLSEGLKLEASYHAFGYCIEKINQCFNKKYETNPIFILENITSGEKLNKVVLKD